MQKINAASFSTIILLAMILSASWASAAKGYAYIPNVDPHTRYNPLRSDCYYYYGYGSCNVTRSECDGVVVGLNRWVNLGDACDRNLPPTVRIETLSDIEVFETQKVIINVECIDEDPVNVTYSGWTTSQITKTDYDDAGTYDETVTCTDSFGETAKESFYIIIKNTNRNPLFRLFEWTVETPKPVFTGNYT